MLIHVTAEDIKASKKAYASSCAVATALKRITGLTWQVGIYHARIATDTYKFHLPPHVSGFIGDFDFYGFVEPFSFEFEWSMPYPEVNYK